MRRANLLSLFEQFLHIGGDVAVVQNRGYRRQSRTYAELSATARSWSYLLASRSIAPGDRILLWGSNCFEWLSCFWAILLRGAVVVPMDAGASPDFVERVTREAQVKLILSECDRIKPTEDRSCLAYDDLPPVAASTAPPPGRALEAGLDSTRDDIAEILFTSGTTSEPRGVVLSHGNFLANLEPIEQGIDAYRRRERWFHPLRFVSEVPLSHVFGQFMGIFVPPLLGATVVFENSALPGEILRSIKRERATVLVAVPRMLDAIRSAFDREIDSRGWRKWFDSAYLAAKDEWFWYRPWRFRRLHALLGWKFWAFLSGGAALSSDTEGFFKRIGYAVVQGYGMTETASLMSVNHPFDAKEGSVGKVLAGRELRIADDGEILVRGENVSSGYWEKGALRRSHQEDRGWLHTGDLGELDAQGNLRFRGRKKNVIVTPAGLNVFPEDLEAALRKQSAIRDAVVVALEVGGNAEPVAALLLNSRAAANLSGTPGEAANPAAASADQLARSAVDSANAALADYQRIRRWLVWPEPDFPRTPTGKPRLSVMASQAADFLGAARNPALPSALASSSSPLPANLKDLSSLDRVELLSKLEHRYNVELNETQFANAQSLAEIQMLVTQPSVRRTDFAYPGWAQRAPVRLFRLLLYYAITWPITLLLAHPRACGNQHLAGLKGPVVFVSNHITRKVDIGLILFTLPARFRHRLATAMGGETLETFRRPPEEWIFAKRWFWQLGYFSLVALFNVYPLPQLSGFRESFRFAGESADRGYSLVVFPEGTVNERNAPGMIPFQPGIGLLTQNLNIPVVPLRIDGLWRMKREHRHLAGIGELTVLMGAPVVFPPSTTANEITARLQKLIEDL